jgi:tRNA G18 (ribose-2'-O)-methylase SpoU
MADTVNPQGIVAVCRFVDVALEDVLDAGPRLIAVLCQVRDPGNAGTVLRAADSAGADAVVFTTSSVDIYNPKAVRSTAGSLFHLPVLPRIPRNWPQPARPAVLGSSPLTATGNWTLMSCRTRMPGAG